jgi:hypothetical protein
MRFHLVTATRAQQLGAAWKIAPSVALQSLVERGRGMIGMMMPMPGERLDLHLPDGREITASIVSFGLEVWKDAEGDLYTAADPSSPSLTLVITGDPRLEDVPAGTEVWLRDAISSTAHDESRPNSTP